MISESSDASFANVAPVNRSPCLPIAVSLGLGIALDHALALPRLPLFLAGSVLLAILLTTSAARRSLRVAVLLSLFALLGAAAHGAAWNDRATDSVTRLLGDRPALVRLTGRAVSAPRIERRRDSGRRAAWPLDDRTRLTLAVMQVAREGGFPPRPVSGQIQLTAAGHLSHVGFGDLVEVTGWIARPATPSLAGGFDLREYLRLRGTDAVISVDHPDAVRRIGPPANGWRRSIAETREQLSIRFAQHLSQQNGPIGAAMILGDRSAIPLEIRDAYIATGAMHILAISGLNVGILAAFLAAIGRLLTLPVMVRTVAIVLCAWAYALLTDLEPPVVRATLFLSLWALATMLLRRASLLNTAAATSILLLLHDPLLLFDVGAQLSFLAVLGIAWSASLLPRLNRRLGECLEDRPWVARAARPLLASQLVGLGAWLFTAPLIASEFGLVSPIGFLLNVLLIPLATVVMCTGYAFFGACLFVPVVASHIGALFDAGLSLVNAMVVLAGQWRLGHVFTPSPPAWWLLGAYATLATALVRRDRGSLRGEAALLAWVAFGLIASFTPTRGAGDALRMTLFDVGHGAAMLLEAPNGRMLLFDCGAMEDDRRAADAVCRTLRTSGGSVLDAVVISHADLDHCGNLPALLRGASVGSMIVSRTFLDFAQPAVRAGCDAARASGAPVRLVSEGDRLQLDPAVAIEVLHPPDRAPGTDNNADSLVLRVRYGGRVLLLTGDVDGAGQQELLQRHAGGCDLLVAPHHGGASANTPEFADWARPRAVAVTSSDRLNVERLAAIYPGARLYATPRDGTIIVRVAADGRMSFETARERDR